MREFKFKSFRTHSREMDKSSLSRRSGRSTRLIDAAIQELFTTGQTTVIDHYDVIMADKNLFSRVLRRLNIEHHNMQYTLDHHTLTIKLGNK